MLAVCCGLQTVDEMNEENRGGERGTGDLGGISPDLLNLPGITRRRGSSQRHREEEDPGTEVGGGPGAEKGVTCSEDRVPSAPGILGRRNAIRRGKEKSVSLKDKDEDQVCIIPPNLSTEPAITRRHSYSQREKGDSIASDNSGDEVFSEKTSAASVLANLVAPSIMRRRHSTKTTDKDKLSVPDGKVNKEDFVTKKPGERVVVRRSSLRRRPTKDREDKTEDRDYSHMKGACDKIIEKVHAERAVQNTIEALADRWKMIMFMYEDLVAVMDKKKERDARAKSLKKQFEMAMITFGACAIAIPVMGIATIVWIL